MWVSEGTGLLWGENQAGETAGEALRTVHAMLGVWTRSCGSKDVSVLLGSDVGQITIFPVNVCCIFTGLSFFVPCAVLVDS